MTHADEPLTVEQVAQHFHRARRSDVQDLLETLAAPGSVVPSGTWRPPTTGRTRRKRHNPPDSA
jgi:hypothetical protein